ncbi:MAG: MotA/TolQ/ExbB proton channel family protein [Myxococcaceae bacterium]|nr:MotA/TolQ/ExbB proton channel family protein [Myxococcaceae bacterium]
MLVERLLRIALLGSSWVMYLLLVLSVFSIAAMVERVIFFRRNADQGDALVDALVTKLRRRDRDGVKRVFAESSSLEAQVIGPALEWMEGGAEAFSDAVESQLGRKKKDLERGMSVLGTLGSHAPFIGLFGTVIGVIEAFHQLGEGQNKAAMGNVMSGIAEALVATGVGLFVAIPAVVAYNMLQKRIASVESNVATITKQITASLKAEHHGDVRGGRGDTRTKENGGSEDSGPVSIPSSATSDSRLAEAE